MILESVTERPIPKATGSHPRFLRSNQMVNCLCQEFLYSEKRPRDYLFRAIERVISECSARACPVIAAKLTREAAVHAQRAAALSGLVFSNWQTASKALFNTMLGAGVLLTHGNVEIPLGIMAQATDVVALKADYGDTTEMFLLEVLIRRMGDITIRDHTPLAHALFRQFDRTVHMDDLEDRVVLLLARLADRVELRDDGCYVVRDASSQLSPYSAVACSAVA